MQFYGNILLQNWLSNLPCCFIVTFCHKICSPTYHDVLSLDLGTNFFLQHTLLVYRNILSQNLFTYLPRCYILIFCYKIYSATYHAVLSKHFFTKFVHLPTMLFYRNILSKTFVHLLGMMFYRDILSQNLSIYVQCCFIETFFHKIGSPSYHAVLS